MRVIHFVIGTLFDSTISFFSKLDVSSSPALEAGEGIVLDVSETLRLEIEVFEEDK
jgi:hypothetical protein